MEEWPAFFNLIAIAAWQIFGKFSIFKAQ